MTQKRAPLSNLHSLSAQWRLLGLASVAIARHVLKLEHAGVRGAWTTAYFLELWVRTALITHTRQIEVARAQPMRETADDDCILHMQAVATALLALALFLQQVRQRRIGCAEGITWVPAPPGSAPLPVFVPATRTSRISLAGGYYDTS